MLVKTDTTPRYIEPRAFVKARRRLKPGPKAVLDELVALYKKAADEQPVAVTARQLGKACSMSYPTVTRHLKVLEAEGFIVTVSRSSYDEKHKPSRHRLTMFPCEGKDPTHNYIHDAKEWRRQPSRRKPDAARAFPETVTLKVRTAQVIRALEDAENTPGEPLPIVSK
jgi:DNA-binding transcriptional ArsR family regulator